VLSPALQESAASGSINTAELAARIKRLNGAAMDFEASKDLSAYCEALGKLGEDFKATE
jgi:predicted ABC-type ATPase